MMHVSPVKGMLCISGLSRCLMEVAGVCRSAGRRLRTLRLSGEAEDSAARASVSGPLLTDVCVCLVCTGSHVLRSVVLQVYVQVNREAELDESVRSAGAGFFRRLERREDQALELWRQFRQITVDEYKRIYQVTSVREGFMCSYLRVRAFKTRALSLCKNTKIILMCILTNAKL